VRPKGSSAGDCNPEAARRREPAARRTGERPRCRLRWCAVPLRRRPGGYASYRWSRHRPPPGGGVMPAAEIGAAEIYRSAVQNLDAAERAYMAAVDALDRAGRDARTLERSRRNCEDAEGALLRALDTAHTAHRS